jgi:hypothetical protein
VVVRANRRESIAVPSRRRSVVVREVTRARALLGRRGILSRSVRSIAMQQDVVVRVGTVVVEGRSMLPTLRPGDRLLVGYDHPVRDGDVVVVRLPDGAGLGVKRALRHDDDGWWVERDNPAEGADSWLWGSAVADADVLGVVRWRLWPRPGRLRPGR